MTGTGTGALAARTARLGAWLVLPLLSLGVLRLFPPLALATDASAGSAWLAPGGAILVALCGALAALLAVAEGLRGRGALSSMLDAAAAGSVAAGAAMLAFEGPAASGGVPSGGLAIGLLAAALPLLAARLAGTAPLPGRTSRVAAVAAVFAWVEVAPLAGLLFGPVAAPAATALLVIAAALGLVAVAATGVSGVFDRSGWVLGFAAGAAVLAGSRPGSADVLPGLLAVAAALGGLVAWIALKGGEAEDERPAYPALPAPEPQPETDGPAGNPEAETLARELRRTIAELLAAREQVALQREEIEQLRQVDPATRVATREAILARLHNEVAEARRYAHPLALVLVDLDGLAGLNRQFGLAVGDAVLAELALRLRMRIREADAIGRLVGDVFLAILPHTDERGATVFADAVRTRLTARPVQTNGGPVQMTVSIGITMVRAGVSDGDDHELLARAEEALSSARAAGGNRIAFDREHGLARIDERPRGGDAGSGSGGEADKPA